MRPEKKWDFRLHRIEIPNVCMEWANFSTQAAVLWHKVLTVKSNQRLHVCLKLLKKWAIACYRISILQNSILIDPTLLEISVFSYCTFKLAIKRIDESIIIFCILCWFWDYPERGTQRYRFGFSVVRQWNIDVSFIYLLFFQRRWTWSQIKR